MAENEPKAAGPVPVTTETPKGVPFLPIVTREPDDEYGTQAAVVSERIRASAREELEEQFQHFLAGASPEEVYFLMEVFSRRESFYRSRNATVLSIAGAVVDMIGAEDGK